MAIFTRRMLAQNTLQCRNHQRFDRIDRVVSQTLHILVHAEYDSTISSLLLILQADFLQMTLARSSLLLILQADFLQMTLAISRIRSYMIIFVLNSAYGSVLSSSYNSRL